MRERYPQDHTLENMTLYNQSVKWFDDISTIGIETIEDIAYNSLVDAVNYLFKEFRSTDMSTWLYGDYHTLYPLHLSELDPFNAGPYPFYGNAYTLAAASGRTVHHGASERAVYSLDPSIQNVTHAWTSIPGGQNGNPLSKHYKDQLEKLYVNRTDDSFGYHTAYYYISSDVFKSEADVSKQDAFYIESTLIFKSGG